VLKNPLEENSLNLTIASRLNFKIIKVIKPHNTKSTVLICKKGNRKLVVKYGIGKGGDKVRNEINWYLRVGRFLKFVPKFLGEMEIGGIPVLILDFIEDTLTIDDISFSNRDDYLLIKRLINKSLVYLQILFETNLKRRVSLKEANTLFLQKFERRYNEARRYNYLKILFNQNEIVINGEVYPNFREYIEKIVSSNLFRYLTPRVHGVIHGDLHCGNILVQKKNNKIFFIDPNGNLSMPIEYDYGKIFHSIHGGYGSIMRGKYKLKQLADNRFEFSLHVPKFYESIFCELKENLSESLFVKSFYTEAMHFATMLPHHAKRPKETKALYLRGVLLFKELFNFLL